MHTNLPFAIALTLVLAPSAICLLFAVLYHSFLKRKSSKQREDLAACLTPPSHRRDDFRTILLALGIITLAFTASAFA